MSFLVPTQSVQQADVSRSAISIQRNQKSDLNAGEGGKALASDSSSVIHFYPEWCHCLGCLIKKKYRHRDNIPFCTRCRNAFLCPPSGVLSRCIFFILANVLFFCCFYSLDSNLALDTILPLIILELTGLICGIVLKLMGLPALLAPLILGIIFNNIPGINFFQGLTTRRWIKPIRNIALTIILTRAGIELSPKQLKKLKGIVPCCAFGPCIVEAFTCALLFYLFFKDAKHVQLAMCFVAGFALAAVSPAVVVPGVLSLKKKGYGVKSGIPTLLIAASSIDDVLAISCFAISLSFVETGAPGETEKPKWKSYAGISGLLVGIVQGFLLGILLHFIPSKDMGRKKVPYLRVFLLLLLNIFTMLLYEHHETHWLSGAGSVGVLTTSFIGSFGWRSVPHWKASMHKVENTLAHIWTLFVPMLFGTIGSEILVKNFNWSDVAILCGIIGISLCIRCLTMFSITLFVRKANFKERLFCALSWIPKATVQATLAPLVVTEVEGAVEGVQENAKTVVLLAVLGILITAPLGAILISLTGKRLLRRATVEDEFPNGEGEPEEEIKELVPMDQILSSEELSETEGEDRVTRVRIGDIEGPGSPGGRSLGRRSVVRNKDTKRNSA